MDWRRVADVILATVQMLERRVAELEDRTALKRRPPDVTDGICHCCGATFPRRSSQNRTCSICRRARRIAYAQRRNAALRRAAKGKL